MIAVYLLYSLFSVGYASDNGLVVTKKDNRARRLGNIGVRVYHTYDGWMEALEKIGVDHEEVTFDDFLDGKEYKVLERHENDIGAFSISVSSLWKNNTIKGSTTYDGVYKKSGLDVKIGSFDGGMTNGFATYFKKLKKLDDKPDDKPDEAEPYRKVPDDDGKPLYLAVGGKKFNVRDEMDKGDNGFVGFVSHFGFEALTFDLRTEHGPAFEFTMDKFYVSKGEMSTSIPPTTKITDRPTPSLAPTATGYPTLNPTPAPRTPLELVEEIAYLAVELFFSLNWAAAWEKAKEAYAAFMEYLENDESANFVDLIEIISGILNP